ncbi:MAG: DUF1385 domain-containing protein [Desulfovibrio sp.]|nr:DUF1385 domain-containing protein [Desulfovibrio sp.]
MDGVMMRNGDMYGLAVRLANGEIYAQRLPWKTCLRRSWLKTPFIRGFPILLETLINGIHAINRSVAISEGEKPADTGALSLLSSFILAILMAIGLFVAAPHFLSLLMHVFNLGGDVEGLSFHLWDGFYKCAIFIGYIWLISFVPDIRRVFEYHGAEHKTIHAWETGEALDAGHAFAMSRLHPRCGTTFLLFVISISIILQALLLPLILSLWTPATYIGKHVFSIMVKLALVIPISAVAYELIRFAGTPSQGILAQALQAPGLALQRLTTREPSMAQIEVAIVALAEALESEEAENVLATPYHHLPASLDA